MKVVRKLYVTVPWLQPRPKTWSVACCLAPNSYKGLLPYKTATNEFKSQLD